MPLNGDRFGDVVQEARTEYRMLAEGLASPEGAAGDPRAGRPAAKDAATGRSDEAIAAVALPEMTVSSRPWIKANP